MVNNNNNNNGDKKNAILDLTQRALLEKQGLLSEEQKRELLVEQAALLLKQRVPCPVPEEWFKKLSPTEIERVRENLAKHNNFVSPRDRELLRMRFVILINGEPYEKRPIYVPGWSGPSPWEYIKLTPKEIKAMVELSMAYDQYENTVKREGEAPWWEVMNITKEEYHKRNAEIEARWYLAWNKRQWQEDLEKKLERMVSPDEAEDYMNANETKIDKIVRELRDAAEGVESSFRELPWYWRDRIINRTIFGLLCLWALNKYRLDLVYTLTVLWIVFHIVYGAYLLVRFRKRASKPFEKEVRSIYSEAKQYKQWKEDRKFFGFETEEEREQERQAELNKNKYFDKADNDKYNKKPDIEADKKTDIEDSKKSIWKLIKAVVARVRK